MTDVDNRLLPAGMHDIDKWGLLRAAANRMALGAAENVVLTILRDASAGPEVHARNRSTLAGLTTLDVVRLKGDEQRLLSAAITAARLDEFVIADTMQARLKQSDPAAERGPIDVVTYRSERLRERADRYPTGDLADWLAVHERFAAAVDDLMERQAAADNRPGSMRPADRLAEAEDALRAVEPNLMPAAVALELGTRSLTRHQTTLDRRISMEPDVLHRALAAMAPAAAATYATALTAFSVGYGVASRDLVGGAAIGTAAVAGSTIAVQEAARARRSLRYTRARLGEATNDVQVATTARDRAAGEFRAGLNQPTPDRRSASGRTVGGAI